MYVDRSEVAVLGALSLFQPFVELSECSTSFGERFPRFGTSGHQCNICRYRYPALVLVGLISHVCVGTKHLLDHATWRRQSVHQVLKFRL